MSNIDFGFGDVSDYRRTTPTPSPTPIIYKTEEPKKSWFSWAIVVVLAIALAFTYFKPDLSSYKDWLPDFQDEQGEVVIDEEFYEGATLVFIYEGQQLTAEQEQVLRGVEDFVKAKNMLGYRLWDEEQPIAKQVLEAAALEGVNSPLAAIIKDKKVIKTTKFPKSYSQLEELLNE